MADSAPALKTLLKLIGKKYLKQMFDVCKVETRIDWSAYSETFEDDLCDELTNMAKNSDENAKNALPKSARFCSMSMRYAETSAGADSSLTKSRSLGNFRRRWANGKQRGRTFT